MLQALAQRGIASLDLTSVLRQEASKGEPLFLAANRYPKAKAGRIPRSLPRAPLSEAQYSGRNTAAKRTMTMVTIIETATFLELINLCMAVVAAAYLLWWLYGDPRRK